VFFSTDYSIENQPGQLTRPSPRINRAGGWSLATTSPELLAVIAPICGGGLPEFAFQLKHVPVWAFHGAEDDVVKLEVGQRMVDALRACGGNVRFIAYPGVGHDSWTQTYDNPELYEWFLQQRR